MTEQLDGVPELQDEWHSRDLFNSGGAVINVPSKLIESQVATQGNNATSLEKQ